jgi:hypothetical protein
MKRQDAASSLLSPMGAANPSPGRRPRQEPLHFSKNVQPPTGKKPFLGKDRE